MARKSRKGIVAETAAVSLPAAIPAWVYARISNDSDHADDSIENQIAICKEYINTGGELVLGGIFTDLGYSGTDFERPGYTDMMTGILDGSVKCVIVKDLSRVGRTYIEVGELLFDTFVQYGIRFISVNDNYDSFADDAGRKKLLILFKNLVNHMYSRDLGKKIKSAHTAKKKRGEPAGLPPFGYRHSDDNKCLVICPEEAEVVRMIFDMRQKGVSAVSIAKNLNRLDVATPQNRRYQLGEIGHEKFSERTVWTPSLVSRMLHNLTYTGALVQGKYECYRKKHRLLPKDQWIIHENMHEAIISKEQFEAVARLLAETAEKYRKTGATKYTENAYAGKVYCSRCGKAASRQDGGHIGKKVIYYYACAHCLNEIKYEQGLSKAPRLPLVRLDGLVMETVGKHMDALVRFDELEEILAVSNPLKQKRVQLAKELAKEEKAIADAARNLSAAYTHHLDGVLDLREYELVRSKIESDKIGAEARLSGLKAEQARYDTKNAIENQWLVKFREFRDSKTPTKEMAQALIRRITIEPMTNKVEVQLNYTDSFDELNQLMTESGVAQNAQ